jgi:hypothetical protein
VNHLYKTGTSVKDKAVQTSYSVVKELPTILQQREGEASAKVRLRVSCRLKTLTRHEFWAILTITET